MKTRIWKNAGPLAGCYGLELHYRADDGELCPEREDELCAIVAHAIMPRMGRAAVAELFEVTLGYRVLEFTVAPPGEMVLVERDASPEIVAGFLAGVSYQGNWLSRCH